MEFDSNTDQTDEEALASTTALETSIAAALTEFEKMWPQDLMSGPVIHTLVHYPRIIFRWNSVRNYWCYFNERLPTLLPIHFAPNYNNSKHSCV